MQQAALPLGMVVAVVAVVAALLAVRDAASHCDTLDGPVVKTARAAIEKGDVTPVLRWVKPRYEPEVRAAFARTLTVRKGGPEARALADTYFLETLVRFHREGEGVPYSGLRPAGTPLNPAVVATDRALETGSADELVRLLTEAADHGLRERFARALATKQRADRSVAAGREYVEAYVEFVHYAEQLSLDAAREAGHQDATGRSGEHAH